MCLGPQIFPQTEKGRRYKTGLRILIVAHCVIIALNFVAASKFLQLAILGLLFAFILYIIQRQCNYQMVMMYILISLFFAVSFMAFFLTPIQNNIGLNRYTPFELFIYIDSILSFVYYVIAMIYCFFPYREFKAIAFSRNPALRNYFDRGDRQQLINNEQTDNAQNSRQRVDYQPNYGNIPYDPNRRNNDNGNFQVFRGQGIRIG